MAFRLLLPREIQERMIHQALTEQPYECCGLLAGVLEGGTARIVRVYPLVNSLQSRIEYESDPKSLLLAYRSMNDEKLDLLAVYHSHPTSHPVPSLKDLSRRGFYEDVIHFIISLTSDPPLIRGWWLGETDYHEAEWEVV